MLQANKIRIPLYNNFLKNRRLFDATRVKFCSGANSSGSKATFRVSSEGGFQPPLPERKSLVEYMPIVVGVGSGVGTCIGSYYGYQDSKKDTYINCIITTICAGWIGGTVGYVFTMFSPVTVPIVIVATIVRQMETVLEPEKKTDVYTLHDKRPT
jgi:hypothetical protein